MADCMPKEQREYIEAIKKDMLESTNMTENEAYSFAFRCWQCGYQKVGRNYESEIHAKAIEKFKVEAMTRMSMYQLQTGYPTEECRMILRDVAEQMKGEKE